MLKMVLVSKKSWMRRHESGSIATPNNAAKLAGLVLVFFVFNSSLLHFHTTTTNNESASAVTGKSKSKSKFLKEDMDVHEWGSFNQPLPSSYDPTGNLPKVAWLMSYPNSGTSFTLHMTRTVSGTTTGTNYGLEGDIKDSDSVPIYPNHHEGPYYEVVNDMPLTPPPNYILTKTHCGGYCVKCGPKFFIETPETFLRGCANAKQGYFDTAKNIWTTKDVYYDARTVVKKAIHILRSPYDNIVSRFHDTYSNRDEEWRKKYPRDREGFQKWCKDTDEMYDKLDFLGQRYVEAYKPVLSNVFCRAELYKYTQWHNLAFGMSHDLNIPTLIVHYNDYALNFDETVDDIVAFLELPRVAHGYSFELKTYDDYFTPEQAQGIAKAAKELSTVEMWYHVQKYYNPYLL
jgi:hypothetical protein